MKLPAKIAKYFPKKSAASVMKREIIAPTKHWLIGLSLATLLFFGSVAYIAIDFYIQLKAPRTDIEVSVEPLMFREQEVARYTEVYRERERVFNELRADRSFVPPEEDEEGEEAEELAEEEAEE